MGRVLASVAVLGGLAVAAPAGAAPAPPQPAVVESQLLDIAARTSAGRGVAVPPSAGVQRAGGRVLVEIQVEGDLRAATAALQTVGLAVTHALDARPLAIVEGWIDPARIDEAAALPAARTVDAARAPVNDLGPVTTQGDARHQAPAARALGPTGAGQKVGIISDSFDTATATSPPSATVRTFLDDEFASPVSIFIDDAGETDEGRAMGEIIQDLAPGAALSFASGTSSLGKATAVNRLRTEGMTVIADDIAALSQPFFQDGVVAQAADQARAAGIAYFASAGNRGRQSWEGTYANAAGRHDFTGGDTVQTLTTLDPGEDVTFYFQWAEPWGGATTDLDALLLRSDGAALTGVTGGTTDNIGGNPAEVVSWTNSTGVAVEIGLRIARVAGTGSPFMKWIHNGDGTAVVGGTRTLPAQYMSPTTDAINPDAASAAGVLAVAAIPASDAGRDTPESFSSRGPKERRFSAAGTPIATAVRAKPDLAANDCVSTSVAPRFATFCGTSAAAPHAAAIAALLRSASPAMDVADVYRIMTDSANTIACTSASPANDCGAGFVLADKVVGALDRTAPVITSSVSPAAPDGANGWYRATPTVSFAVADGQSTVVSTSGCGPTPIEGQGTVTVKCTAVSGGGTAELPVTVRHDSVGPSAPVVSGIVPGRSYPQNEVPKVLSCTAADGVSGLASCVVNGTTTTARGSQSLSMTATDVAGNTTTTTVGYVVGAPIDRIRTPLTKALFKKRPTVLALTGRGFRLTATGVPNGTLTVTVKRGVVTIARGVAKARNGIVTVTVRASNPVLRKQTRRSRGKRITVSARFLATSGSTRRSSVTRPIAKLG